MLQNAPTSMSAWWRTDRNRSLLLVCESHLLLDVLWTLCARSAEVILILPFILNEILTAEKMMELILRYVFTNLCCVFPFFLQQTNFYQLLHAGWPVSMLWWLISFPCWDLIVLVVPVDLRLVSSLWACRVKKALQDHLEKWAGLACRLKMDFIQLNSKLKWWS